MSTTSAIHHHKPAVFTAKWETANVHLKKVDPTLSDKVLRVTWNIFSILIPIIGLARVAGWIVEAIAQKVALPAAWCYPRQLVTKIRGSFNSYCFGKVNDENKEFRKHYSVENKSILTPDGARLNAYYFKHTNANAQTDTLIYSNPNAAFSEQMLYKFLIDKAIERNSVCNFVVYDYRGVSKSKGDFQDPSNLVLDQDSVYQFVRDELRVPPNRIRTYGWSIGGGASGAVKAMRPECTAPYVNERSFGTIYDVVKERIARIFRYLLFWVPDAMRAHRHDLVVPFEKIKGEILIVCHTEDETIRYPASAYVAIQKTGRAFKLIVLYQTPEQIAAMEDGEEPYHHSDPLENYTAAPEVSAVDAIADFILPPSAATSAAVA